MHPITVNESLINQWVEEFRAQMLAGSYSASRKSVEFKREINTKKPGAITIRFTTEAYMKMWTLVTSFNSEIGWHGLVRRPDETTFEIYDILVYPQVVTAATVNTDQQKYQEWLMNPDTHPDEVFNAIRMQGHSHVNMAVSPSATDLSNQERTLEILDDNDFYIFLIWNKRNERSCRVFDMANNVVYDENDTVFEIAGMNDFRESAESMLERIVPAAPVATSYGSYAGGRWVGGQYIPAQQSSVADTYVQKVETSGVYSPGANTPAWAKKEEKASPVNAAPRVSVVDIEDDDEPYGNSLYDYYRDNNTVLNAYGNRSCIPYGYGKDD